MTHTPIKNKEESYWKKSDKKCSTCGSNNTLEQRTNLYIVLYCKDCNLGLENKKL